MFATTEDALPAPGDQLPVVGGDQPVLLLRTQAGDLGALSNLCAHRGTLLVEERTNAKRFEAIERHVASRGFDAMRPVSAMQTTQAWMCNWKVAIGNAMESYHLFKVHPKTLEPYTPTSGSYYITGSAHATATGGTSKGDDDYLLVSLPPGFVGVFTGGNFLWQAVYPVETDRCEVRTGVAVGQESGSGVLGKLAEWFARVVGTSYGQPDFLPEDKAICERIQRGVGGDFVPGKLVPAERVVADFGHYLNWRIHRVEPPAVHEEPKR